ncbi:MAG TPA: hypothetical protein VK178_16870 [Opitutaceae bacterium]|nr:hypothetical protein [Opitutaceae bacterium]
MSAFVPLPAMEIGQIIVGFSAISLLLHLLNSRVLLPIVTIANRWVRWILFSLGVAYLAEAFGWTERPFWATAVLAFLGWFLVESVYHWLAIRALSLSPLPLFPRFVVNSSGEEWPTQRRLFAIREWLRREKFHLAQSLKAEIAPGIFLRLSVYQDASNQLRLQVAFIPQPTGAIGLYYTLSSRTESDVRYVTDNLHLPFGGFYPENWLVERRPWIRSLARLVARHRRRLRSADLPLLPWTTEPLEDLNRQQGQLEKVNTELGFLHSHQDREEFGKISKEGRYRVWKEIWMLNYLGRTVSY